MEEELKRLNVFFDGAANVEITRPFSVIEGVLGAGLEGWLSLERQSQKFSFRVEVPVNFPLAGLQFYYQGNQIASHLLRKGLVCASSPFSDAFDQKMQLDLDAIGEWIDGFVLSEDKKHYEYLPIERHAIFMLFDEPEAPVHLKAGDCGEFHYMKLPRGNESVESTFMALDLGGKKAAWSSHYSQVNPQKALAYWKSLLEVKLMMGQVSQAQIEAISDMAQGKPWPSDVTDVTVPKIFMDHAANIAKGDKGVYCFLDREPLNQQGNIIRTVGELHALISPECKAAIKQIQGENIGFSLLDPLNVRPKLIYLMLGYKIPRQDEIHWELIIYPLHQPTGTGSERRKANQLVWGMTVNNTKERFFGRGMLHSKVRNGRILILGLGAVGSNLAHSLVRGGATSIAISDFDHVETGNVCRSTYQFDEIHLGKDVALMFQLMQISPFVSVSTFPSFAPSFLENSTDRNALRQAFEQFDIIIDCTANDAVAWMLDQIKLKATVINLSISDEARHFVAVTNTGGNPILPAKHNIFSNLGQKETKATFYEGAGCWHPTFQASFADINLLLQQYIADANHRLEKGHDWATTVLETKKGEFGLRVVKREDC